LYASLHFSSGYKTILKEEGAKGAMLYGCNVLHSLLLGRNFVTGLHIVKPENIKKLVFSSIQAETACLRPVTG